MIMKIVKKLCLFLLIYFSIHMVLSRWSEFLESYPGKYRNEKCGFYYVPAKLPPMSDNFPFLLTNIVGVGIFYPSYMIDRHFLQGPFHADPAPLVSLAPAGGSTESKGDQEETEEQESTDSPIQH